MSEVELNAHSSIEQLCPSCGLCCNGVLFGDVELQRKDDPERLSTLGLILEKKGRKLAFPQPCACFDGQWCRIYPDRPARCHAFKCRVLNRLEAGELTLARARSLVQQVQNRVKTILNLMRHLGDTQEQLPLNRRYSHIMSQPIDLTGDGTLIEARAQLMLEVDKLMKTVLRDFLA